MLARQNGRSHSVMFILTTCPRRRDALQGFPFVQPGTLAFEVTPCVRLVIAEACHCLRRLPRGVALRARDGHMGAKRPTT